MKKINLICVMASLSFSSLVFSSHEAKHYVDPSQGGSLFCGVYSPLEHCYYPFTPAAGSGNRIQESLRQFETQGLEQTKSWDQSLQNLVNEITAHSLIENFTQDVHPNITYFVPTSSVDQFMEKVGQITEYEKSPVTINHEEVRMYRVTNSILNLSVLRFAQPHEGFDGYFFHMTTEPLDTFLRARN